MTTLLEFLKSSRLPSISVPFGLVREVGGDGVVAMMLAQMAFLTELSREKDGWFDLPQVGDPIPTGKNLYQRCGSWEFLVGAGPEAQMRIRRLLIERGLLEERRCGVPARLRYRVRLESYLQLLERAASRYLVGASDKDQTPDAPGPSEKASHAKVDPSPEGDEAEVQALASHSSVLPETAEVQLKPEPDVGAEQRNGDLPCNGARDDEPCSISSGNALFLTEKTKDYALHITQSAERANIGGQDLADCLHGRICDQMAGALVDPPGWLKSMAERLASGKPSRWKDAGAAERRQRQQRMVELQHQLSRPREAVSPQTLARPDVVYQCLSAMPWNREGASGQPP